MNNTLLRIGSIIILTLCLCISIIPINAFAQQNRAQGVGSVSTASSGSLLISKTYALAAGLIPCGNGASDTGTSATDDQHMCTFTDLILLVKNITNFLIVLTFPLAVISFTYAGFLILTSQGSSGKISQAKKILMDTAIGFGFVLAAWLIVYLIVTTLVTSDIRNNDAFIFKTSFNYSQDVEQGVEQKSSQVLLYSV